MEKIDVEASPKSGDAKEEEAKESPHSPLGASSPSEKHQQPGSSERLKDFKKGLDSDAARGRRAQGTAAAVKEKRDERLLAMRMGEMNLGGAVPGARAGRREAEEGVRDSIVQWVEMLRSEDPLRQLEAVTHLRKLLSIEHNPPIAEVVACGVVPRLVEFLTAGAWPQLVFESAWALTNIASGSSEHTRVVMDAGAVPIFVQLLASREDDVKEQSVWALGNIAGDSAPCRDFILQHNVVPQLLLTLQNATKISLLRNAAWTLSNLCRGKPQPDFELLRPLVPTLARLIYSTDDEVVTDSCWALSYLSDGPNERIQAIMEAGVARRLCELMMHANYAIQTPALRTIGNFVTGDDVQTAAVLNVGVLPCLHAMLSSPKKGIRKEACWTVSNITAGNRQQIQQVIDSGLIPRLLQLASSTGDFDIVKEATWAVSNATSGGSPEQCQYLASQGCIGTFCKVLETGDSRILQVALEGIENLLKADEKDKSGSLGAHSVLEAEGGLDALENLQDHNQAEVADKAVHILTTYFGAEEVDPEAVTGAPVAVEQEATALVGGDQAHAELAVEGSESE